MRITNAYYVYIDFDGDIYSEAVGTYIFTTLEEVEEIVKEALMDLEKKRPDSYTLIDDYEVPLRIIIEEKKILDEFIEYGGDDFGNWYIHCEYIGEE